MDQDNRADPFHGVGFGRYIDGLMRRRDFLALLGGAAVARTDASCAQPSQKTYRIGYLSKNAAPPLEAQRSEPLWQTLQELGYIEGANLVVERRYAAAKQARMAAMAAELIGLAPDLIFAMGSAAGSAAKAVTDTIPIVVLTV